MRRDSNARTTSRLTWVWSASIKRGVAGRMLLRPIRVRDEYRRNAGAARLRSPRGVGSLSQPNSNRVPYCSCGPLIVAASRLGPCGAIRSTPARLRDLYPATVFSSRLHLTTPPGMVSRQGEAKTPCLCLGPRETVHGLYGTHQTAHSRADRGQ